MTRDEPPPRRADGSRGLHERLRFRAKHLGADVFADLRPADKGQRRDEADDAEGPRDEHKHDREKELRDGRHARRHDSHDRGKCAAVPAARDTERQPDPKTSHGRHDDDREAEPCSREDTRPLIAP